MIDPSPYFQLHFFVCTNERPEGHPRGSCARKSSARLRDYAKARAKELGIPGIRVNSAGCLDRCELGPVMVIYPEGIWYSFKTHDDIDAILDAHLVKGGRVPALMLTPDQVPA